MEYRTGRIFLTPIVWVKKNSRGSNSLNKIKIPVATITGKDNFSKETGLLVNSNKSRISKLIHIVVFITDDKLINIKPLYFSVNFFFSSDIIFSNSSISRNAASVSVSCFRKALINPAVEKLSKAEDFTV